MKKQLISMMVVFAMLFSISGATVFATDIEDMGIGSIQEVTEEGAVVAVSPDAYDEQKPMAEIDSQDLDIIYSSLAYQYSDPYSGIADVIDMENAEIGGEIQVFDYLTDGLVKSETSAYPLYSDSTLCAIAFVASGVAQIDTQIADEMADVSLSGESVAFLYDAVSLYIYDGSEYKELHKFEPVEGRAYLPNGDPIGEENVGATNLCPQMELNMSTVAVPYASSVYVDVGFQNQPAGSVYCWACADACIGNKITGKTITGYNFAKYFIPSAPNTSVTIEKAISYLNQYYSGMRFPYVVYGDIPTIDQISYFLGYSHPIYGQFAYTGNLSKRHATVIRGTDSYNGYISLMDPDVSIGYRSATMAWVSGKLTFKFTNSSDNTEWMLTNSAYPNYWA